MNKFNNYMAYCNFLYSLEYKFPEIEESRINFYSIETNLFQAKGRLEFSSKIVLKFNELINFSKQRIVRYAYEVYQGNELLYFYDPQPHPNDPSLAATLPHHQHIPPDIKHNRKPAPGFSFDKSNLPFLIQEIIYQLLKIHRSFSTPESIQIIIK